MMMAATARRRPSPLCLLVTLVWPGSCLLAPRPRAFRRFPRRNGLRDEDAAELCARDFVVVEDFVDASFVASLRRDARALRDCGRFVPSRVGTRQYRDGVESTRRLATETRRSETAWLRPPVPPDLGDVAVRRRLDEVLEELRTRIAEATGEELVEQVRTCPCRRLRARPEGGGS
mmetsp:Transcript_13365/g.43552  ORF Transcript_13365/g.43552 Transcript_13365/m.43552 type:complete len:175 (-) Transcript_13365:1742-2266(-)